MGPKGRKQLVEAWAQYLPLYTQTETINQQVNSPPSLQSNGNTGQAPQTPDPVVSNFNIRLFQSVMFYC